MTIHCNLYSLKWKSPWNALPIFSSFRLKCLKLGTFICDKNLWCEIMYIWNAPTVYSRDKSNRLLLFAFKSYLKSSFLITKGATSDVHNFWSLKVKTHKLPSVYTTRVTNTATLPHLIPMLASEQRLRLIPLTEVYSSDARESILINSIDSCKTMTAQPNLWQPRGSLQLLLDNIVNNASISSILCFSGAFVTKNQADKLHDGDLTMQTHRKNKGRINFVFQIQH